MATYTSSDQALLSYSAGYQSETIGSTNLKLFRTRSLYFDYKINIRDACTMYLAIRACDLSARLPRMQGRINLALASECTRSNISLSWHAAVKHIAARISCLE